MPSSALASLADGERIAKKLTPTGRDSIILNEPSFVNPDMVSTTGAWRPLAKSGSLMTAGNTERELSCSLGALLCREAMKTPQRRSSLWGEIMHLCAVRADLWTLWLSLIYAWRSLGGRTAGWIILDYDQDSSSPSVERSNQRFDFWVISQSSHRLLLMASSVQTRSRWWCVWQDV